MMKKTPLSIIVLRMLLLLSFLIPGLLFAQDIHFQTFGVENGISQPTVTSIYQDEIGIIWIGTKDGLNRYNGTDFYIFRNIYSINKQFFSCAFARTEAAENTVYVKFVS